MTVMFLFFIRLGKAVQHLVFSGSNYTFHANSVQWRNWEESRHSCKETGGDLVSIESLEEWNFVKNTIQSMRTGEYFIGLKKDGKSGEWRWISDNSTVNAIKGTFPWAKGEPSGDGDCLVMYTSYRQDYGEYCDLSCFAKRKRGFICESPAQNNGKEGICLTTLTYTYTFCRLLSDKPGDLVVLCYVINKIL